ncbi:MAG: hypothetical protein OXD36_10590 [Rhodobacter sp.]|nr:hypothetical protein [Rhodobacter sp.]
MTAKPIYVRGGAMALAVAGLAFLAVCGEGGYDPASGAKRPGARDALPAAPEGVAVTTGAMTAPGAGISPPRFGSVYQTVSEGVAEVRKAGITRRADGSFTLEISRGDGSRTALNSAANGYVLYDAASPTGRTAEAVEMIGYGWTGLTAASGVADYSPRDFGDWIAGGYWLHVRIGGVEMGAVIDGPEISRRAYVPRIGAASYRGYAGGIYGAVAGTDAAVPYGTSEVGEYGGDFTARADFRRGTVSGSVRNIVVTGTRAYPSGLSHAFVDDAPTPAVLVLEEALIGNGGTVTGTLGYVNPRYAVVDTDGSWGGQLSARGDRRGNPRLIGGTHAGSALTAGGTELTFVGTHYGASGDF